MSTTTNRTERFPAGWYDVDNRVNTVGYWDGEKWTGEYAPGKAPTVERLRMAVQVLEGNAPIYPSRPTASPSRGRRTATSIDDGQIIHACHVAGRPISAVEIREALGLPDSSSNSLSIKVKKMCDEGTLKRIGERRSSRYVVV